MQTKTNKKTVTLTAVLLCAVLVVGCVLFLVLYKPQKASEVVVYVNGSLYKTLPLKQDAEEKILSANGKDYNVVVVKNGKAYMKEANCKNQTCIHSAKINKVGQTIVCSPHNLVIVAGKNSYEVV